VQLLTDFICVKLAKLDKSETWNQSGYDITNFTIPKIGDMHSNFLKLPTKEEPVEEEQDEEEDVEQTEEA